jgi:hypothetical protein
MKGVKVPHSEHAAAEAGRARLPDIAEQLRGRADDLGAIRRTLPLPDERTLCALYESETGLELFPAVSLAMELEVLEDATRRLASQVDRVVLGLPPGLPAGEPDLGPDQPSGEVAP